jgi:hypothetical protein
MKAINKLALLASLAVSSLAFADDVVGTGGTVTELELSSPSADLYLAYHGRIVISTSIGKAVSKAEYRWGGVSCGTRVLSDAMVASLQRALESAAPIVPRYQLGQGDVKCLVGYRLAP